MAAAGLQCPCPVQMFHLWECFMHSQVFCVALPWCCCPAFPVNWCYSPEHFSTAKHRWYWHSVLQKALPPTALLHIKKEGEKRPPQMAGSSVRSELLMTSSRSSFSLSAKFVSAWTVVPWAGAWHRSCLFLSRSLILPGRLRAIW